MRSFLLGSLFLFGIIPALDAQVVILREGDFWHFLRGSAPPPLEWKDVSFDDDAEDWELGRTGIGYGDDDDATVLDDMQMVDGVSAGYVSVYLRATIEVPDSNLDDFVWSLKVRYDDGFVAYIDGIEVARRGVLGTPPAFDEAAEEHEISDPLGFDETILLLNGAELLEPGPHVLAVEVHNASIASTDLSFSAELAATPFVVTGIEPSFGPVDGGDTISIIGMGFSPDDTPAVKFGDVNSEGVEVVDWQLLRVLVPPGHGSGAVDIEIEDSRGTVVLVDAYSYISPEQTGLRFGDDGTTYDDEFVTADEYGDLLGEGTFEIWFKADGDGGLRTCTLLAIEAAGGGDAFRIELQRFDQVRAWSPGGEGSILAVGAEVPGEAWHHLAFTFSPSHRKFYINGVYLGGDSNAMGLPEATRLRVGDGFGDTLNFWGTVESVRVWSVERSADEIRRLRYAHLDSEPGLESAWPLLEGNGGVARNIGPTGSHLILGDSEAPEPADPDWSTLVDFPSVATASIEPSIGSIGGGGTVRIYGKGFTEEPPTEVFFDRTASPHVRVVSSWEIEVEVPSAEAFGGVNVTVDSGKGSFLLEGGYFYRPDEIIPLVVEGDVWHYFVGTVAPDENWALRDFDPKDRGWDSGPTGIGYGDLDDATDVETRMLNAAATLYARVAFELDGNPADVELLRLRLRYDDGYVAYLNGEEITRANILGQPPLFDELASNLHEVAGGAGTFDEEINITFAREHLLPGRNILAMEVHNTTLDSSDLSLSAELDYGGDLAPTGELFVRGDVDGSGSITVTDCVIILSALFQGFGDLITCREAADTNDDSLMDLSDPIYLLNFLFLGGPRPPDPFFEPGPDLDSDGLDCRE